MIRFHLGLGRLRLVREIVTQLWPCKGILNKESCCRLSLETADLGSSQIGKEAAALRFGTPHLTSCGCFDRSVLSIEIRRIPRPENETLRTWHHRNRNLHLCTWPGVGS